VAQIRYVLGYAAQQVSGISTFYRDPEHIAKAFATAGMQAHAGVRAAELVRLGFTDVDDIFDGHPGAFDAFGEDGDTERMLRDLETTHHVTTTDIKRYSVGGPIQPAAEALERLIQTQALRADDVASIDAHLPQHGVYIVNNRTMPDINVQYILSVLLLDGEITFASSHDYHRLNSPPVREMMSRVRVIADPTLDVQDEFDLASRRTRHAIVTVTTRDGRELTERVDACRGDHTNPMSWDELTAKAQMALLDVMPKGHIDDLVQWVHGMETAGSVRELRPFLEAPTKAR
jgi:2-methylcitrate dehydratase PrpD